MLGGILRRWAHWARRAPLGRVAVALANNRTGRNARRERTLARKKRSQRTYDVAMEDFLAASVCPYLLKVAIMGLPFSHSFSVTFPRDSGQNRRPHLRLILS